MSLAVLHTQRPKGLDLFAFFYDMPHCTCPLIDPLMQSVRDWGYAFALMSRAERRAIFDLAFVTHGLDPVGALTRGLSAYLTPHLVCAPNGLTYYLRSPHHRQLIQVNLALEDLG